MMHGPMNVKFLNNTSKWQMEFNSAFKGLKLFTATLNFSDDGSGRKIILFLYLGKYGIFILQLMLCDKYTTQNAQLCSCYKSVPFDARK
jgi:hypothetical protein